MPHTLSTLSKEHLFKKKTKLETEEEKNHMHMFFSEFPWTDVMPGPEHAVVFSYSFLVVRMQ